jgi:6,7-dimethyl-8-ribityllumazine synthase
MSVESSAGLIEMAFTYTVAIAIGIWQVIKMRREIARDRQARRQRGDAEETNSSDK